MGMVITNDLIDILKYRKIQKIINVLESRLLSELVLNKVINTVILR